MSKVQELSEKYGYLLDKYQAQARHSFFAGGELEYQSAFNVAHQSMSMLYIRLLQALVENGDINEKQ